MLLKLSLPDSPQHFGHMTQTPIDRPNHSAAQRLRTAAALAVVYGLLAAPILVLEGPPLPPGTLMATVILAAGLIALSAIDFQQFRLPDSMTLPLIALGIAIAAVFQWDGPLVRLMSAAAGFASLFAAGWIYKALRGRPGLGLGDAKLFAASGAWLGAMGLPSVLLYGCGLALVYALGLKLWDRGTSLASAIPFGPFLAAGTWLVWLYGPFS
jgi:prepilin signal peptidase PulO-like enzyme (type II secretory pathway)